VKKATINIGHQHNIYAVTGGYRYCISTIWLAVNILIQCRHVLAICLPEIYILDEIVESMFKLFTSAACNIFFLQLYTERGAPVAYW